jgi:hypothetical protein
MLTRRNVPPDPESPSLIPYQPTSADRNAAHWWINGYRASIFVWTAAEWASLEDRPQDAQYYPSGVWCALRIDPPA